MEEKCATEIVLAQTVCEDSTACNESSVDGCIGVENAIECLQALADALEVEVDLIVFNKLKECVEQCGKKKTQNKKIIFFFSFG